MFFISLILVLYRGFSFSCLFDKLSSYEKIGLHLTDICLAKNEGHGLRVAMAKAIFSLNNIWRFPKQKAYDDYNEAYNHHRLYRKVETAH